MQHGEVPTAPAVEVIVKLAPAAAQANTTQARAVHACLASLGVALEPLHPSVTDPELATYAVTHVDEADAQAVIRQLNACEGVEGAYAKPRGEPP